MPSRLLIMGSRRIDLIREGYKYVHEEDGDKLLEIFDDEIEFTDPITQTVMRGKEEVAQLWRRSLGAVHSIVPGEVVEIGDVVLVVAHHDFYDRELTRLGEGVSEMHRFSFRGDRIVKLEVTTFDEIPADVRERLTASDPS